MKKIAGIILLVCTVMFTSCLNVTERIVFNKDGSGKVVTTVDMSEMMGMLSMFMPDSLKESMGELDKLMGSEVPAYKGMRGISNVSTFSNEEYVYNISYEFDDVDALNKAMAVSDGNDALGLGSETKFKFKKNRLCRTSKYTSDDSEDNPLSELGLGEGGETDDMMQFMNKPTYTIVYELPKDTKKVKIKGQEASDVDEDNKEVSIEYNLFDFLSGGNKTMQHDIKF